MRLLNFGFCLFAALATLSMVARTSEASGFDEPSSEEKVRQFVEAFNNRNLDQMLAAVDEKVQWLTVEGTKVAVETEGKQALSDSMKKYFKSCPSCRSSLVWVQTAGSRVTAMERATWTGKNGQKAQSSVSVYEFQEGKILRVYYFPAEGE